MNLLYLFIGLLIGFVLAFLFLKSKKNSNKDLDEFQKRINDLETEKLLKEQDKTSLKERFEDKVSDLEKERENLISEIRTEREKVNAANMTIAKARAEFVSMNEKLSTQKAEMEEIQKKFSAEFENLANKILEDKSKRFTEQNKTNLDIILNPLKEKITAFEKKVDDSYKAESKERTTLQAEIKHLVELNK
ncbi:MAG TPA: DNA recombination protein RmuC, partial [Bacteroidia bacterium]|nr:DNA recombination protein RmuC [Bacteroidia bacterium]